ncbi:hypothetical protein EV182_004929, partial [Spiromyces aspiralis]
IKDGEVVLGDPWADVEKPFPGDGEGDAVRGNIKQIAGPNGVVRRRNPGIRVLISIGGWTWSGEFSEMAKTHEGRARFVTSVCRFVERYGFDGADIDWEYPVEGGLPENQRSPDDAANYALLLEALRGGLDELGAQHGKRYELSIAAPAPEFVRRHLDMGRIARAVDFVNLMAYDFEGSWSQRTGHHSRLFSAGPGQLSVDSAVEAYLAGGVPPSKLVLGVGFYGRGFANVEASPSTPTGLGAAFSGIPKGTWEDGVFDYSHLATKMLVPGSAYQSYWDDVAKVPYMYNAQERVTISYDDENSVGWKMHYVRSRQLGGAMIWELNQDPECVLLDRITQYLG